MRSKKLKALFDTYEELVEQLRNFDNPFLVKVAESWTTSLNETKEMLDDPEYPVKPSQFVTGFEQGLREIPSLLADLSSTIRSQVTQAFNQTVSNYLPDFFKKSKEQLESVISKGKIKNENEWYLVRLRMDDIEGRPNCGEEFEALDEMLRKFEESL